jgi:Tfp pilus assembly PilM family ATPase
MGIKNISQYIGYIKNLFNKPIVIVEIGNDWLKILECNPFSRANFITKASFIKLSQIRESVSGAIADVFRNLKLNKNSVFLCIPRSLVTVRILELPSIDPKEIADMIELQIGKQTPYSKEEIVFSHRTIDVVREGYTKEMLVIAKHSLVKERLVALEKIGINVRKVALSSEGVYNWFSGIELPRLQSDCPNAIIIVDIDSNYSDFIMLDKGKPSFTKNILIGANNLIEERERYQEKFIDELKRSVELYYEEIKGKSPAKLFLLGASKNIPDLANVLSVRLDIPCQTLDTIKDIRIEEKTRRILQNEDYKFLSATPLIGLAMRCNASQFDLMPTEARIKKIMEEKKKYLTVAGILFTAIFTMLTFLIFIHIYNKNTYKAQLEERLTKIKDGAQGIEKMRYLIGIGQERLNARGDCLTMLSGLYEVIPKEIYLTSVDIERKKQMIIKGRATAMSDVFKFVGVAESSRYFKNVKNTYTATKKDDKYEYVDFEIICVYEE